MADRMRLARWAFETLLPFYTPFDGGDLVEIFRDLARALPLTLWGYSCGCGGLCDSGRPCPMGERRWLKPLGRAVARRLGADRE